MYKANKLNLKLSAISLGVVSLFSASAARADDDEVRALTQPQSTVQVEMIGVDQNSAKFGEYNGLYGHPSGAYPNAALNIRGGGAYTNNEQGNTSRWSVTGDNLGLTSRSANVSIADQGSWNFGVNFDQLQHNTSNSYQTPYNGALGQGTWVLPSNLQGAQTTTPSNANLRNDLQNMNISNTRYNSTVSGTAIIDRNSNITFEYNNLTQSGAKLGAFSSAPSGGTGSSNQVISILPMPTTSQTDTVSLGYSWKDDNKYFGASYFGSFFQNGYNSVSIMPYQTAGTTANGMQTLSTAPNNAFNQLNLNGGYDFSNKTKMTANLSMGQNTQNQGFNGTYDSFMVAGTLPAASMNGLVNTTHADIKLVDQSVKDLALTAAAKYDNRENLSQSNIYGQHPIGGTGETAYLPNTPMSLKQLNLLLSADYRITQAQRINLTASNDNINRSCNQYGGTGSLPITNWSSASNYGVNTSATTSAFNNSSSCVSATSSNENRLIGTYKIKATEDVNVKMSAGYANRKTSWDQSAIVAMPYSTGATYYPTQPMGYNSGNQLGFYPFFEASRKQFIGKASTDWQASDNLSFTLGGKYTNDIYPDSTYGVQNGNSWSLNLDSSYKYAEAGTIVGYATQQNQSRNNNQLYGYYSGITAQANPANGTPYAWQNTLKTTSTTVGLGFKQGDLVGGKITLYGDATMSFSTSQYNTNVPYVTSSTTTCTNPTSGPTCGIVPGIVNNLGVIKLGGVYQLDKNSKIGLAYWYQHLYSNDYYYNGYTSGMNPSSVVPTNQSSPSYSVNVISANYTYTFD